MNIYYFANQIYQLSYAWPLYNEIGGSFIVRKYKTLLKFKRYLRGSTTSSDGLLPDTPTVRRRKLRYISDLSGIILSQSNARIHNDPEISRSVFIGHGTGDKKYGEKAHTLESFQYLFVSGPKHMAKFADSGLHFPEESLIKIGNLRFDDYINGGTSREVLMDRIGIPKRDRGRKTVLYAPTWQDGNGTLGRYAKLFCKEITAEHNLIIRPHHFDSHKVPALKLWAKINGIKRVYFSNSNRITKSDTMHDFLISDILISDTSSVLYEYLITGKPIIVANTDFSDLHSMPHRMNIMTIADSFNGSERILDVVNRNLSDGSGSCKYAEMLNNCFYFNDGGSVQRAKDFVNSIASELKQ
ncbi:MAG: CDP-glycerol glycerophosphotransferase family protein [Candidatus Sabulitectum sp.]|nr:CDP-glycerol glycerophosphotransferase family protein [Candidatus Sabulitectum sp.]